MSSLLKNNTELSQIKSEIELINPLNEIQNIKAEMQSIINPIKEELKEIKNNKSFQLKLDEDSINELDKTV